MANKVAVQILVGQNEEPFLKAAIQSVDWVDYFTVVNTSPYSPWGQVNAEIVKSTVKDLGVELRYEEMQPDKYGIFSFAEARNAGLAMMDKDDYCFIVDSDDVHYLDWEVRVRDYIERGYDSITAHFFHLMIFKDVYQAVYPREIIFKAYEDTRWASGVHEQLNTRKFWPVVSSYHYLHYGYIKPQPQVFDRWKFYSDIEGDIHHYDGQDPENIISDRLSVSKVLPVTHPEPVQQLLESYPSCPPGALRENWEAVSSEKVGLVLLTYNDTLNLRKCLDGLVNTRHNYQDFEVLAIDLGSIDESVTVLEEYTKLLDLQIYEVEKLLPLAETLNFGFSHFRQRHDIKYIGWVHPDMRFDDQRWLRFLVQDLQTHPKIGKICAANTRDNVPDDYISGHEQCYIMRKEILNTIGLFDEGYQGIGGYEDWDLNKRIMLHEGYKVMISPNAQVFHEGMATRSRRDTTADQIANAQYYFNKWKTSGAPV